jgi:hypothetical protein
MAHSDLAGSPDQLATSMVRRLRIARRFVTSLYRSRGDRALFREVRTYCMFIGHARSGHSIVGALLDAHPEAIVADEVDALQYVAAGFSRDQIFHLLLARSRRQAVKGRTKGGRDGKTYSYHVPGQWQGQFTQLRVMGDSKAGVSTQRLADNPELLPRLHVTLQGVRPRVIHVVRNPYDNISTMMLRGGRTFDDAIGRYLANCETIRQLRRKLGNDLLTVRQENLIARPGPFLEEVCGFLGLSTSEEYRAACASILFRAPARSRGKVEWTPELIAQVQEATDRFDFLHGYTYKEPSDGS